MTRSYFKRLLITDLIISHRFKVIVARHDMQILRAFLVLPTGKRWDVRLDFVRQFKSDLV
jgi:hypothetical protein